MFWMFYSNWPYDNNVWIFHRFLQLNNCFLSFKQFLFLVFEKWLIVFFSIISIKYFFFLLIHLQAIESLFFFFFLVFHVIITVFFSNFNSSIIVFKYKFFELFYCYFLYNAEYVQNIHHHITEKKKEKKVKNEWKK